HPDQTEKDNGRADERDQSQTEQKSQREADQSSTKNLASSHFSAKNYGTCTQGIGAIQTIAIIEVFVEIVSANLQEQSGQQSQQKMDGMKNALIHCHSGTHQQRTESGRQSKGAAGFQPDFPGRLRPGRLCYLRHGVLSASNEQDGSHTCRTGR